MSKTIDLRLSQVIVLGKVEGVPETELACGEERCPFFQFITPDHADTPKMVCKLPSIDGIGVIDRPPWYGAGVSLRYKKEGAEYICHQRVPKCLEVKPLSKQAKKAQRDCLD